MKDNIATQRTVVVIGTGGTIAGIAPDPSSPYAYDDSKVDIGAILEGLPGLANVRIESDQALQIGSEDFTESTWRFLRRRILDHLQRPDVDGVVLTQGTDTIEEMAYFLQLTRPADSSARKPVIVTGAMRPAGALSSDASINLFQSIALAAHASTRDRGVLVLMNERIHSPHAVIKSHSFAGDSFTSPEWGPLGIMLGAQPQWAHPPRRLPWLSLSEQRLTMPLPPVELIWAHAGIERHSIDRAVADGVKGLVYAGTGNGSVPMRIKPALLAAAEQACLVVRASRTGSGIVARAAAEDDDALGTITSVGVPALKARIALQLALAIGLDRPQTQSLFQSLSFQN